MKDHLDIKKLASFLIEANKNSYANKLISKAMPSRLASEDYHFEKNEYVYHDTYFGSRDFMGEEIVYKDQKPIWGANYFGCILSPEIKEKELYDFLRQALVRESLGIIPVRGPANFANGNWLYEFSVNGDLTNFSGLESITFKAEQVYRCLLHGGLIQ